MRRSVLVELDIPKDWRTFRLPPPLHQRLQELLDRQDREGRLAPRETPRGSGTHGIGGHVVADAVACGTGGEATSVMSPYIGADLARLVRKRAGNVCEYCCLPQSSQEATFHVDHIQPAVARGLTTPDNLALACVTCSLRKAARTKHAIPARSSWFDSSILARLLVGAFRLDNRMATGWSNSNRPGDGHCPGDEPASNHRHSPHAGSIGRFPPPIRA